MGILTAELARELSVKSFQKTNDLFEASTDEHLMVAFILCEVHNQTALGNFNARVTFTTRSFDLLKWAKSKDHLGKITPWNLRVIEYRLKRLGYGCHVLGNKIFISWELRP